MVPLVLGWILAGLAIGVPFGLGLWRVLEGATGHEGLERAMASASLSGGAWQRVGLSLGVCLLIGVMAMALGAAPAWMVARGRSLWAGVFLTPLFLPAFLAYSGWGMARAPGTMLGAWLEGPGTRVIADAPVWAGRVMAVGGMALWAWPLAMLGAVPSLARIDQDVLDAVSFEAGWRGRLGVRLRLALPGLAMGVGAVGLVAIGSAVPLHLAQIETDSIRLWRLLDQTSAANRWTAWVGAWPTLGAAVASGILLSRRLSGGQGLMLGRTGTRHGPGSPWYVAGLMSAAVWVASVLGPTLLFAWSIRERGSLATFWRLQGGGVAESAGTAGVVAITGCVMALLVAYGLSGRGGRARATRWLMGLWLIAAIMPGVLVGSATLDGWSRLGVGWVTQTSTIVVLTHVCRFGAVAALAGAWVARAEPRELAGLRALDGATGPMGWLASCPGSTWVAAAGAGLGMGLLSLYEIESAVIVQPPGVENLARQLLALLHFSRDEELSAAAVWLVGLGLIPALGAGAAVMLGGRRGGRRWRENLEPQSQNPETHVRREPDRRGER